MTATHRPLSDTTLPSALSGIHHLGLTVTNVKESAAWYQRVLRLEYQFEERHHQSDRGGYTVILGVADGSFSIGMDHHPGNRGEAFDETRTGLDHLSFRVASLADLHAWAAHLDSQAVAHSGVYAMEGFPISLLTFRDPDGIQLELLAFHG